MTEHKKYQKTAIVIVIGALLFLIMRLYFLSGLLFLLGLIIATYPFIKNNTNEANEINTEYNKFNCNTNCNCNNLNCEVISDTESENTELHHLNEDESSKIIVPRQNTNDENNIVEISNLKIEDKDESKANIKSDTKSIIEVDFENNTKNITDEK